MKTPLLTRASAPSDPEVCDCAPTGDEKRVMWRPISRRGALAAGAVAVATVAVLGTVSHSSSAYAAITYDPSDYPTWADVEQARSNESTKASEITRIEGLISELQASVAAAQQAAQDAGDAYYAAQQEYLEAAYRADELQSQADEQSKKADEAATAAAKVATALSRSGGDSTSYELLFADSAGDADELLSKLGQMDKLAERNQSIYADAASARDSAQQLSNQAADARTERDRLQKIAQQKLEEAQAAQAAAEQALADQEDYLIVLQQQLAALKDTTSKTVAEYQDGVEQKKAYEEEQRRLEEERRKKAAEEAARQAEAARKAAEEAAAAAAAAQPEPSSTGTGTSTPSAPVVSTPSTGGSGWVHPHPGASITSGYGYRTQICGSSYCSSSFHAGVDLAEGCGTAILAAHSGTVSIAGPYGGYGNYVRIDNGDGVGTGYGHIVNGGILVGVGQSVSAGQVIAYEGNTGNSFGCHCHFEVYLNGATTNPMTYMAGVGVSL
ncbi:M23 family metallopeptidase [Microbacterium indicum]|uniref:M23 family metallopeptidase n=1 Tax=Microbacterium indicum TaxID=358100 RepID=UPI0004913F1D|nr:M23 family metallopeptidase [Microbacterium indicum]